MLKKLKNKLDITFYEYDNIPDYRNGFLISDKVLNDFENETLNLIKHDSFTGSPLDNISYFPCSLKENVLELIICHKNIILAARINVNNKDIIASFNLTQDILKQFIIVVEDSFIEKIKYKILKDFNELEWKTQERDITIEDVLE